MEYKWYFGDDPKEWIKMPPGRYPTDLWGSLNLSGQGPCVFIYDEYETELLYVIPNANSLFVRLAGQINRKFKVHSKDDFAKLRQLVSSGELLYDILDVLIQRRGNYNDFHAALDIVEEQLLKYAQRLRKEAERVERMLKASNVPDSE